MVFQPSQLTAPRYQRVVGSSKQRRHFPTVILHRQKKKISTFFIQKKTGSKIWKRISVAGLFPSFPHSSGDLLDALDQRLATFFDLKCHFKVFLSGAIWTLTSTHIITLCCDLNLEGICHFVYSIQASCLAAFKKETKQFLWSEHFNYMLRAAVCSINLPILLISSKLINYNSCCYFLWLQWTCTLPVSADISRLTDPLLVCRWLRWGMSMVARLSLGCWPLHD